MARGRSGRVGILAVAAATFVALAASASGAEAADLGTENGITYVSETSSIPPSQPAAPTASCPDGTSLVGAGLDPLAGISASGIVASLRPNDGQDGNSKPDDGLTGYSFNTTDTTRNTVTYAMCAPVPVKYPTKSRSLRSGGAATQKVSCPGETRVLSGGFYLSAQNQFIHLHTFLPFDNPDGNQRPDDGWKVRASNLGPSRSSFQTWAFCQGEVNPVYDLSFVGSAGPGPGGIGASCPSQKTSVVGPAGFIRGAPNLRRISGLYPVDITGGFEAGDVPDDTAVVESENNSPADAPFGGYAVCTELVS